MALQIVETPFGPRLIDSDEWRPPRRSWPYGPTPLELLAARAGLDDEELRDYLHSEIAERRGYAVIVARTGDSSHVTPVAHQHAI